MLGDNPEKSRNPLKKAMRKRNAKTVQFTEPQYFEPSDREYSSDEEDNDGEDAQQAVASSQAQAQTEGAQQTHDSGAVADSTVRRNINNGIIDPRVEGTSNGQDVYSGDLNTLNGGQDRQGKTKYFQFILSN